MAGCPPTHLQSLREQVHDNLRRLGLDVLDVVNLRTLVGIDERATVSDTVVPQFEALAELQQQGLIRHLGLSTVSLGQLAEAQQVAPVVCVQNFYNIANRVDEAVLAATDEEHIAYVPYFPLGGFSPLQSDVLELVAKRLDATPMAVAQSWLLQHSPNIMLIPGTSSVAHLRENIVGAALTLPPDGVAVLDAIWAVYARRCRTATRGALQVVLVHHGWSSSCSMGCVQRGAGVERLSPDLGDFWCRVSWWTSTRSRPSASISASTPYRADRSSRPVSTVSAPCHCGTRAGNADSTVAPRWPWIRIAYRAGVGSTMPESRAAG